MKRPSTTLAGVKRYSASRGASWATKTAPEAQYVMPRKMLARLDTLSFRLSVVLRGEDEVRLTVGEVAVGQVPLGAVHQHHEAA
ncbi:hypothetical protein [Corallococcus sicarius]|uniref:hypothetical protein n=1 Tax=Corallococcus sicarius TaxID=2316726 RepID=UPI00142EFDF2|nr:hypothetical protein [Corallococcus sicarius]